MGAKEKGLEKGLDRLLGFFGFGKVPRGELAEFRRVQTDLADWYGRREDVINRAAADTGLPDRLAGYQWGVKGAKLVSSGGKGLGPSELGSAQGLGFGLTDIRLRYPIGAVGRGTVYHEVGAHAARNGVREETINRLAEESEDARVRYRESGYKDPELKRQEEEAHARFMRYTDTSSTASDAVVDLVRAKYGVKVEDPTYWDSAQEVLGGLWKTRANAGVSPETVWDAKFVRSLRERGNIVDENRLKDFSDEALAELANRVPAVALPIAGAGTMLGVGRDPEVRQDARGGVSDEDAYVRRVKAAVDDAIPFIKEREGFRNKAYKDAVGVWTIGYGQTELNGRAVREGDLITEEDASRFVETRARRNAVALYRQNPWTTKLSQGALSALYDAAYNLGTGAFSAARSPNLNAGMASADGGWDDILWQELPTYANAGGKRLQGLVNRRTAAIEKWRK